MKIIINADDFGVDIDRDIGITYGVLKGYITSVSVITTNKIGLIRKILINLIKKKASIGIHINLTDNPLTQYQMEDLCYYKYNYEKAKYTFWKNCMEDTIYINRIKKEIDSQINKFYKKYKFMPSHIDGHNHCNIFNGKIEKIFEEVSIKHKIHLRIPYEKLEYIDEIDLKGNCFFDDYYKFGNKKINMKLIMDNLEYFFKYDMYLNNYMCIKNCKKDIAFIGTIYGYFRNPEFLTKQINNYKKNYNVIQLMTHPGFYCKILKHNTPFSNKERMNELKSLKVLKRNIVNNNIQYITYKSKGYY